MSIRGPSLALVVALFCLPLFVGLGRTDAGPAEAIYMFFTAEDAKDVENTWTPRRPRPLQSF